MKMVTNTCVPVQLTLEAAAKHLRVQEDFMDEFEEIFVRCMEIAKPKYRFAEVEVCHGEADVAVDGKRFDSKILKINLCGLTRAFATVATCGRELYELSLSCDDPLERFWVDGVSEMLLGQAVAAMRDEIRMVSGSESLRSMGPGSLADFPIVEQKKLFAMLDDPTAAIGVELTDGYLMLPYKSCSGICFESAEHYESCSLCLREDCPKRRAPFDEKMFKEKYGLTEEDAQQQAGR